MQQTKAPCFFCDDETSPRPESAENQAVAQLPGWELHREDVHYIFRKFTFGGYRKMIDFVNKIAEAAESQNHHPEMRLFYKHLEVRLTTHEVNGLSDKDFTLAAKINALYEE